MGTKTSKLIGGSANLTSDPRRGSAKVGRFSSGAFHPALFKQRRFTAGSSSSHDGGTEPHSVGKRSDEDEDDDDDDDDDGGGGDKARQQINQMVIHCLAQDHVTTLTSEAAATCENKAKVGDIRVMADHHDNMKFNYSHDNHDNDGGGGNGDDDDDGNDPAIASTSAAAMTAIVVPMASTITAVHSCNLVLTPYHKELVRNAWKRMNKKGISGNIGSQIFRIMLDKSVETKRIFQHISVIEGVFSFGLTPIQSYHHHSSYFIDLLDEAVNCIDDLSELIPKCNEYCAKHVRYVVYGFKPEFWDIFGEAIISAAREWEGWKKHRETLRAWTILVSFLVDRMRQGYETGVRRQGFASTSSPGSLMIDSAHLMPVETVQTDQQHPEGSSLAEQVPTTATGNKSETVTSSSNCITALMDGETF